MAYRTMSMSKSLTPEEKKKQGATLKIIFIVVASVMGFIALTIFLGPYIAKFFSSKKSPIA